MSSEFALKFSCIYKESPLYRTRKEMLHNQLFFYRKKVGDFVVFSPLFQGIRKGKNLRQVSSLPEILREFAPNKERKGQFCFPMPRQEYSCYSVGVAIFTEKLAEHHILIWNYSALTFTGESSSLLSQTMSGLPMESITSRNLTC